ncbi:hypothetical protein, partial [Saccharopolyspora sp. 6V]|uniref:hypothetical protein n=1 Tax=Saccharopolyspora sp. 6V TaxID=2877239 RepID=UPI001CD47504
LQPFGGLVEPVGDALVDGTPAAPRGERSRGSGQLGGGGGFPCGGCGGVMSSPNLAGVIGDQLSTTPAIAGAEMPETAGARQKSPSRY